MKRRQCLKSGYGDMARMDSDRALVTLIHNDLDGRRGVGRSKAKWINGAVYEEHADICPRLETIESNSSKG